MVSVSTWLPRDLYVVAMVAVDAALQERLHEVSEYLREKGACSGDDCQRLLLQVRERCVCVCVCACVCVCVCVRARV